MLSDSRFWFGFLGGIVAVGVWHRYVKPMPTKAGG